MNEKKAKRLRQLTRHLMEQGVLAAEGWRVEHPQTQHTMERVFVKTNDRKKGSARVDAVDRRVSIGTVRLDPACGLAIYRQMKKRAELQHRPV